MSNSKRRYRRQMIWAEYRVGSTKKQAYTNLKRKLGPESISRKIIDYCYRLITSRITFVFGRIPRAIQSLSNEKEKNFVESIFCMLSEYNFDSRMTSIDGRFAIFFPYRSDDSATIIFADLFHGETREVEITPKADYNYIHSINMIGKQHLLMQTSKGLVLLKVNYEKWEVSVVSKPNPGLGRIRNFVVDHSDHFKVLVYNDHRLVTGNLIGDEIVFNPHREFNFGWLRHPKLIGNQLCGLSGGGQNEADVWIWQYRKIDLATLTEETIDAPHFFNGSFDFHRVMTMNCFETGKRFYVAFYDGNERYRVFELNTETFTWKDTGIFVYGEIRSLFIDKEGVLTVQVVDCYSSHTTFYRLALKKPDSLKNLAWLTIRRAAILFDSDLYEKIRPRLPYGRGLRSLFISDFE